MLATVARGVLMRQHQGQPRPRRQRRVHADLGRLLIGGLRQRDAGCDHQEFFKNPITRLQPAPSP
jgi:hypothetical protein